MYRGFIKKVYELDGLSLTSSELLIQQMTIKRDILSKATSTFSVVAIPEAMEVGDIFGVYNENGKVIYTGVVTNMDETSVTCDQIVSIFDDKWLYQDGRTGTIETSAKWVIDNCFAVNQDTLKSRIFSQFDVLTTSSTSGYFATQDANYVGNFMDFIFELYESYGILVDINIYFNALKPIISIGTTNKPKLTIGNNVGSLRNFDIAKETADVNKLIVYTNSGSALRGIWYLTASGITTNPSALDRVSRIKTKIEFSDDAIETIIANNINEKLYEHEISVEMVLKNRLFDFDSMALGQPFNVYYDKSYYDTILTGYELKCDKDGKTDIVKLKFGKVRQAIENRLFKQEKYNNENKHNNIKKINSDLEKEIVDRTDDVNEARQKAEDELLQEITRVENDYTELNKVTIENVNALIRKVDNGVQIYGGEQTMLLGYMGNEVGSYIMQGDMVIASFKANEQVHGEWHEQASGNHLTTFRRKAK